MSKYQPRDAFFRKAKQEGLRARSAYKLEEIARRFSLLKAGGRVLDLGAAPGGFLQVIARAVGERGLAVGIDRVVIQPLPLPQVKTAVLDVLADDFDGQLATLLPGGPLDLVVSDLAPKTTGIKDTDEARSLALAEKALGVARRHLRPGGAFATKLFMGRGFEEFRASMREGFASVKVIRPEATRGASMEIYVVGLEHKRPAT